MSIWAKRARRTHTSKNKKRRKKKYCSITGFNGQMVNWFYRYFFCSFVCICCRLLLVCCFCNLMDQATYGAHTTMVYRCTKRMLIVSFFFASCMKRSGPRAGSMFLFFFFLYNIILLLFLCVFGDAVTHWVFSANVVRPHAKRANDGAVVAKCVWNTTDAVWLPAAAARECQCPIPTHICGYLSLFCSISSLVLTETLMVVLHRTQLYIQLYSACYSLSSCKRQTWFGQMLAKTKPDKTHHGKS